MARGEVATKLLSAAWPPAPVREICARAQVGWSVGARAASRMVDTGELVVVDKREPTPGRPGRPPVVVAARSAIDANAHDAPFSFVDL